MKIKDQAIKELKELRPTELIKVYDLILSLKKKPVNSRKEEIVPAYLKVRGALKQCKGSLSEDIISVRQDRI
ncbi:MAG: hypothetical protein COZ69_14470 [Deltaproteobacteria bacterium CG_4_8_14_3_um_filter_45_9]|jgi:hypothetical protein|nr:MAG: hypothetical protein COZ69_14470 [Deltaproteobacteria bacterium CG_4_8_14_3_um_filter_45_9]